MSRAPGTKASFERVWFAISPPLPRGLSMPMTTGVIGGTPQVPSARRKHTITARSKFSSASIAITIEVLDRTRAADLKVKEESDAAAQVLATPAPDKVHIAFTGPVPKGKEWMALGRSADGGVI